MQQINLFNPKFCLSNHLKHSWCVGILNSKDEKIPIETIEGVPSLKIVQDSYSDESWCCGIVPFNHGWEAINLNRYNFISFNFYAEDNLSCRIGLKDKEENDSAEVEVFAIPNSREGDMFTAHVPLHRFMTEGFNSEETRLFKIVGYNDAAFYISQIVLSSEAAL